MFVVVCSFIYLLIASFVYFADSDNVKIATNVSALEDEYYLNYDYELNNTSKTDVKSVSLILPNPDEMDTKDTGAVDVLPNIELPDNSLADADLKDHDYIDNIMYVYYGSQNRDHSSYGSELIIFGSVLASAAHLLTIFCILLDKNHYKRHSKTTIYIVSNMFITLFLANLIFMLGVYATKNQLRCTTIALVTNVLNCHTVIWICFYSLYIYRTFRGFHYWKLVYLETIATGISLTCTMVTYINVPNSFHTVKHCFVSTFYGLTSANLVPVGFMIGLTCVYSTKGLDYVCLELAKLEANGVTASKHRIVNTEKVIDSDIAEKQAKSLKETKNCLKSLCVITTFFSLCWYVTTFTLENRMQAMYVVQIVLSIWVNWYIFFKRKTLIPGMEFTIKSGLNSVRSDYDEVMLQSVSKLDIPDTSDDIPLLNCENGTEMKELHNKNISNTDTVQQDLNISTIST